MVAHNCYDATLFMYEDFMTESIRMDAMAICKLEIAGRHSRPASRMPNGKSGLVEWRASAS